METLHLEVGECEPIAVIGFGLKLPQGLSTQGAFWDFLVRGASARTEVPADRYHPEAFMKNEDAEQTRYQPGSINTEYGHFISEPLGRFDAPFFSITPHEAECMDPQQRWLLETSYHALENAGLPLDRVQRSRTSVHVGCFMNDHELMAKKDLDIPNTYHATGDASAMLANRISWFYDLKGPSVTINTACSGSLVALHLACQSIRTRETTMGLVCGSNLIFAPENTSGLSNLNFLSPDGKCYAFDERANGYARGEGIICLIIKSLAAALGDGDTIRAIIRGTGVNSDGRTPGITQPNSAAQISLIRETYSRFGLDPSSTRYFEAHGTGTKLGDPREAEAIADAFNTHERSRERLYVGALKSNIGHLEGASGLASVIKAILVVENAFIPPNIWLDRVNPMIKDEWGLVFSAKGQVYPGDGIRRASVNSFGFGGTNAHAIVDDAESFLEKRGLKGNLSSQVAKVDDQIAPRNQAPKLLVWSSADADGLRRLRSLYSIYFSTRDIGQEYFDHLAYTLSQRRTHFPWRSFSVCAPKITSDINLSTPSRSRQTHRLCFLLTAQDILEAGIGRELVSYAVFRDSMMHSDAILRGNGCQFSILEKVWCDEETGASDLDRPEFGQPICTALQIAIIELLKHWCIKPYAVVGHSSGELAAAYCAGIITKTQALQLAYWRGMAVAGATHVKAQKDDLLTVRHFLEEAKTITTSLNDSKEVRQWPPQLAHCDKPGHLVLPGDKLEKDTPSAAQQTNGFVADTLDGSIACDHSVSMPEVGKIYRTFIQDLFSSDSCKKPTALDCMFASSVYGEVIESWSDAAKISRSDYWIENLVCPARFTEAIASIGVSSNTTNEGTDVQFLGIAPHFTIRSMATNVFHKDRDVENVYSSVWSRQQSAVITAMELAGKFHCLGYPVNLEAVNQLDPDEKGKFRSLDDLPPYPFDHSRDYWLESRISEDYRLRRFPHNEFVGATAADWNTLEPHWNNRLILREDSYLQDHKVAGDVVYSAANMLLMTIEATRQLGSRDRALGGHCFQDVKFSKLLAIPKGSRGIEIQLRLYRDEDDSDDDATAYRFRLYAKENNDWCRCCHGSIVLEYHDNDLSFRENAVIEHEHIVNLCQFPIPRDEFYRSLCHSGLEYGPAFQTINQLHCGSGHDQVGFGVVDMQRKSSLKMRNQAPHFIHPTVLDGILQVAFSGLNRGGEIKMPTYVPAEIKRLWLSANVSRIIDKESLIQVSAELVPQNSRAYTANYITLWKGSKQPLVIGDVTLMSIGSAMEMTQVTQESISLYQVVWKPDVNLITSESESRPLVGYRTENEPQDVEKISLTETACYLAMSECLKIIGEEGGQIERPEYLRKYLNWMRHQIALLENSKSNQLSFGRENKFSETKHQIFEKVEKLGPEGKLITKLAKVLIPIVQGEIDALQILFEDETLPEYYRQQNPPPEVYASVQRYIDCMAHANPHLRILEVGAGTGGMTNGALEALSVSEARSDGHKDKRLRFSNYTFSDVSPAFFQKANENYGGNGIVCRVLNIEKDPEEQGFDAEQYDLVIASNVLHATRDLSSTLRNTRKLLKPDGKLLLVEGISPNLLRTSFIFGCLPGWWLSTESFREWSPLVSDKRWDQLLRDDGFTGVELIVGDASCLSSMMVSTASTRFALEKKSILTESCLSIVREAKSDLQSALALSIQSTGRQAGMQISISDAETIHKSAGTTCIFLQTIDLFSFENPTERQFTCLKTNFRNLWSVLWVTRRSDTRTDFLEQDAVQGISHAMLSENENLKLVTLGLESFEDISRTTQQVWKVLRHHFRTSYFAQSQSTCEDIMQINGALCIRRVLPVKGLESEILKMKPEHPTPGSKHELRTSDCEVEIEIRACSVRSQDLAHFFGKPYPSLPARACGGVVTRVKGDAQKQFQIGARVVAITQVSRSIFEGYIRCPGHQVQTISEETTIERSTALLYELIAAYEAISKWAQLQEKHSVFIDNGSNAIGHATIQLALATGAEVFVTTSHGEDVKKLSDTYKIPASHIFRSRDKHIKGEIMRLTCGRGINVLIVSATGNDPRVALECMAACGKVVEMSLSESKTSSSGSTVASRLPKKNVSYVNVDFSQLFQDHQRVSELLAIVVGMIEDGQLVRDTHPLPRVEASELAQPSGSQEIETSLGNNLLLSFDNKVKNTPLPFKSISNSLAFPSEATYVIAGGLGGLGRSVVEWMVSHGARNFLLLSRRGDEDLSARSFLEELTAKSHMVVAPKCDIGDESTVRKVLENAAESMPPIRGCIQASMVLRSGMFETLSLDQWTQTLRSKVGGSLNLHKHLPSTLDFYIMFSSVCGIIGAGGQSNYAFGCAYQDALARHSAAVGQKAVSIDLGIVDGIGYMTDHPLEGSLMHSIGMQPISEQYLHKMLTYYCNPERVVTTGADESQVVAGIMTEEEMRRKGIVRPRFFSRPLWSHLWSLPSRSTPLHKPPVAVAELQQEKPVSLAIDEKCPPSHDQDDTSHLVRRETQTQSFITNQICLRLSDMLSLPSTEIDAGRSLQAFGVDSLVAMELRNWFREKLGRDVGVSDILGGNSIDGLAEKITMQG